MDTCPYCKEEIIKEAILCKHCHSTLKLSRAERIFSLYYARSVKYVHEAISIPSVGHCSAYCHNKFEANTRAHSQCLKDCEEQEAIAAFMAYLHRELDLTFKDIIWGGGDIDPIPFEKEVRKRFSNPRV